MSQNNPEIRLKLENITKEFPDRGGSGTVKAVNNISLDICAGEFLTLLGPSGCGKTTTLRLIAGFESPTTGRILLDNQDVTPQPPNKRDMALVFQNYALFPHMSVFDNIAYGLQTQRVKRQDIQRRVNEALLMMGLQGLGDRRPNQLSGGQQQRVALARSLVVEPRILLFDEPLSNLDAKLRVQMRGEIHRLQRRLRITSVYVTHDQIEAMALSDRIVVMNAGKIEQIGTPSDIYHRPATRFVADFIGRANFVDVTVLSESAAGVEVEIFKRRITVASSVRRDGAPLVAMLRSESLTLRHDPALPQVLVEQTMFLGSEVEYIVNTGSQQLVVVEQDPRGVHVVAEGETIGLDFVPEAVHLLPA
ncbi:MAG: ABC transporter ATP-binding protein [Chloroflexi bacterium]|nr:ABC transporter ATP-binding protein [Chloroflexota bacterium]MDL1885746.1 ABC transporter ATP-binding protein [Anaerolineae bacterium CFX8]